MTDKLLKLGYWVGVVVGALLLLPIFLLLAVTMHFANEKTGEAGDE